MNKPKVVLAGHLSRVDAVGSSVINLTLGLQRFLLQNPLIEFNCIDIRHDECPECDFLIVECYWHEKDLILKAKRQSKAKLLFAVREVQLPYVDYVFASNYSDFKSGEFIGFPIRKDLLTNKLKNKNSILIDHSWPDYKDTGDWKNNNDWTANIIEWLKDFNITKMARFEKEKENEIPLTNYENFISNTDHFEFFIVTHAESYPWGVLDMVYRGIKVLTPKGFIPQILVDKLQIKEFENKEQLITLLQGFELSDVQDQFVGFDVIANNIVAKLMTYVDKKILYIYDKDNWAIHEVGKLWLNDVKYVDYLSCPSSEVLQNYDIVWFGCSNLWMTYKDFDEFKSIISIHDPIELIYVLNNDKIKDQIRRTKIITASFEVQSLLEKLNIVSTVVPTTGSLPFRNVDEIQNEKLSLLTISSNQSRKNVNQIIKLFEKCRTELNITVEKKIGYDILQQSDYLALFDRSNVYVCMSTFEGGPIPAMEAMQRGCVVLSTAVGQMTELIENGVNGFILQPNEFFDKIKWIYEHPEWLVEARKKSIQIIKEKRNKDKITSQIKTFLHIVEKKYDLGGTVNHDGYISVNLSGNPQIKANILDLDSFCEDNSVDEFLMSHTFEHISPVFMSKFIKDMLRKLKDGGCLKIIHTDVKKTLQLYKDNKIDFRALRDIIFAPVNRRIAIYNEVKQDVMNHQYMWGEEELQEELLFYGFSRTEIFDAGSWPFDFYNYLPRDMMQEFHGLKIPNLGIKAFK